MTPTLRIFRGRADAALVLFLAAAASWTQFRWAAPRDAERDPAPLVVARFEELKDSLPPHGVVGLFSDVDLHGEQGTALRYLAGYSLAPIVVDPGNDRDMVVGFFAHPAAAPDVIQRHGFQILRRYDEGLMLLRRKTP